MGDLISRQAAIDYFVRNVGWYDDDGYPVEDSDELKKIWTDLINGIPSVQPEFEMSEYVNRIATKVCEKEEAFIFATILPWCEEVTQRRVSKKVLEEALIQYFRQKTSGKAVRKRRSENDEG